MGEDSSGRDSSNVSDCTHIVDFIQLLNGSVRGKKVTEGEGVLKLLKSPYKLEELNVVLRLCLLLEEIEKLFDKHDPKNYPDCRFGNKAFSTWLKEVVENLDRLFEEFKIHFKDQKMYDSSKRHFSNSFGNGTRLDYGTGHELEFIYFLMDLYDSKLIKEEELDSVVLVLLNRYFEFIRRLIDRYTLEPAGSKGAWGVDDYQFLPFIFGSSQLTVNSEIDPAKCIELEFVSENKRDYILMRAMEYKINMIKGVSVEVGAPMICNILTSCTWEKINHGLFQLYVNDVQRLNAKKIINKVFTLGVCAMESKVESSPMKSILKHLEDSGDFKIIIFPEKMILEEPVSKWPVVECLMSFYSIKFPLEKAIEYVKLVKPIFLNDLEKQRIMRSRLDIYRELQSCRVPHPNYIVVDHDLVKKGVHTFEEHYDYIVYNKFRLYKPFIEKPIDSDDHNNWIYYPSNAGGGCKKLFRKVQDRSSEYCPDVNNVRRNGTYIYEEFMSTFGTDIKVYAVGTMFAHAEARKSPSLDGKVNRYEDGKEVRYPVILTREEKTIAYRIVDHFRQIVCGFDILRTFDGPYVCDVNGWSFVKRNKKYHIDCSQIIRTIFLLKLQAKYNIRLNHLIERKSVREEVIKKTFADAKTNYIHNKAQEELCSVIVIMRHADRKPKNKLKFYTKNKKILSYFKGRKNESEIKLKSPEEMNKLNEVNEDIIAELEEKIKSHTSKILINETSKMQEFNNLLVELNYHREFRKMLKRGYEYSGINRKVQFKPVYKQKAPEEVKEDFSKDNYRDLRNIKSEENRETEKREDNLEEDSKKEKEMYKYKLSTYSSGVDTPVGGYGVQVFKQTQVNKYFSKEENKYKNLLASVMNNRVGGVGVEENQLKKDQLEENEKKGMEVKSSIFRDQSSYESDYKYLFQTDKEGESKTEREREEEKEEDDYLDEIESVLVIAKWGGDLTEVGKLQAEDLGRRLRQTLYPVQGRGLIRLHSTFRHDFKIFSSDEGRCQITSAAFTKGILDLEGELTPILVTMTIRNKKAYQLLNDTVIVKERDRCREKMNELMTNFGTAKYDQLLQQMPEDDRYYYQKALEEAEYTKEDMYNLSKMIEEYITSIKKEEQMWNSLYSADEYPFDIIHKLNTIKARWIQLLAKFHKKPQKKELIYSSDESAGPFEQMSFQTQGTEGTESARLQDRFDYTKLSDIVDNIRYDLIHMHYLLGQGLEIGFEIYSIVDRLSSVFSPCEYGVTPREKLEIGAKIAWNLLGKILHDATYQRMFINRPEEGVDVTNDPNYSPEDQTYIENTENREKNKGEENNEASQEMKEESPSNFGENIDFILKNDTSASSVAATSIATSSSYLDSNKIFEEGKCYIGGIKPTEMYTFNSETNTENIWKNIKKNEKEKEKENEVQKEKETVIKREPYILNSYSLWMHTKSETLNTTENKRSNSEEVTMEEENMRHIGIKVPFDKDLFTLKTEEASRLGIRTPQRMVRSRYYVTSASHLFSIFNFFKYAHLLDDSFDTNLKHIECINDLHYLSHIVLRVWRSRGADGFFNRLEVLVSSGAKDGFGQNYNLLEKNTKTQKNKYKRHVQRYKFKSVQSKTCISCPIILANAQPEPGKTEVQNVNGADTKDFVNIIKRSTSLEPYMLGESSTNRPLDIYNLMTNDVKKKKFKCFNCFLHQFRSLNKLLVPPMIYTMNSGLSRRSSLKENGESKDDRASKLSRGSDKDATSTELERSDTFSRVNSVGTLMPTPFNSSENADLQSQASKLTEQDTSPNKQRSVPPYCELNTLVIMNRNFGLDRLHNFVQKAYEQIILKN